MGTQPNEIFKASYEKLDPSQQTPIKSDSEQIVIKAPAGSGKTSVLTTAVADYRYEHVIDRICAITYTRAARAEMEERLKQMGITDVEVTTIHVWCRNLLEDFAIKYDFKIRILTETDIKTILQDIIQEYLLRSRLKSMKVDIAYSWVTGNKHMDVSDNYRKALVAIEARYNSYKRVNQLYDFTDYPLYLYDVMHTYNEAINNIDALFVDEFQDVDPYQLWIFSKVNSNKKFFIGDAWQSIYAFRGADGDAFNKLDDFDEFKLKYNYRSYQEIIDYATTVYEALKDNYDGQYISSIMTSIPSKIHCARDYGGTVTIVNPMGDACQWHNNQVRDIMFYQRYKEFSQFMSLNPHILCRTNKQVKTITENTQYEASTIHAAKGLEYDNVLVVDSTLREREDLNVAYVALTRARDNLFVINWNQLLDLLGIKESRW